MWLSALLGSAAGHCNTAVQPADTTADGNWWPTGNLTKMRPNWETRQSMSVRKVCSAAPANIIQLFHVSLEMRSSNVFVGDNNADMYIVGIAG